MSRSDGQELFQKSQKPKKYVHLQKGTVWETWLFSVSSLKNEAVSAKWSFFHWLETAIAQMLCECVFQMYFEYRLTVRDVLTVYFSLLQNCNRWKLDF